jgi:glycosyltransferase involved in cell wall biosynthesis
MTEIAPNLTAKDPLSPDSLAITICSRRFVPDGGGTERHTYRLASALAKRDIKVTVVTGRYRGRPKFEEVAGILIRRLFVGIYVPVVHELIFQLSFFWYLIRRRREYDIVQLSHTQLSALVAVTVARFTGKRIVTRNSTAGENGDLASWASIPFGKRLLRLLADRVDAAVAVSAITEDEFIKVGVPKQKIHMIQNSVEIPDVGPVDAVELRRPLGLLQETFVVVFVGRLSPVKAPGDLLTAWTQFSRHFADTQLIFLGEGELAGELQKQAIQDGLVEQVRFLGRVDNVNDYLLAADTFVLPSISEAMPNALLEAMAVGLPVIASAVGGITDAVEHRQNGLLYTSGDINGLADCLLELAQSPELQAKLGATARQTVVERYDLERMTDRYIALYHELLA